MYSTLGWYSVAPLGLGGSAGRRTKSRMEQNRIMRPAAFSRQNVQFSGPRVGHSWNQGIHQFADLLDGNFDRVLNGRTQFVTEFVAIEGLAANKHDPFG